jgi:hypothetical protein
MGLTLGEIRYHNIILDLPPLKRILDIDQALS